MRSKQVDRVWEERDVAPFNEMMISWNGQRSESGEIRASLWVDESWSPQVRYVSWGGDFQKSYSETAGSVIRTYQDEIFSLGGKYATGFQITVSTPLRVHVSTNEPKSNRSAPPCSHVHIPLKGLSQMTLASERHRSLCSPTSVAAVLRYLLKREIDPLHVAAKVRDCAFDIFGNWVLNVAEASHHLGPSWNTWVEKLGGFEDIYKRLACELPVIVSVRGPLIGSARAYEEGHLLVVIGYDPLKREVICMDPAFETDEKTEVRYPLDGFMEAWARRGHVAYLFEPSQTNQGLSFE